MADRAQPHERVRALRDAMRLKRKQPLSTDGGVPVVEADMPLSDLAAEYRPELPAASAAVSAPSDGDPQ